MKYEVEEAIGVVKKKKKKKKRGKGERTEEDEFEFEFRFNVMVEAGPFSLGLPRFHNYFPLFPFSNFLYIYYVFMFF